ncbi:Delta12-fatty-acid desaturase [Hondaea fermentalgiana]|uniref:Delta12-fatty-acid desaturase n=1 Tax=Hondaea fermentalgiana TaxID=2315210 RepID=A0A2R5FZI1_9STRA|nr:Delta12-fatty-acid desaturase [Hondaea fermentalgiana]|eukprot:GBG24140.1 Delta12-fatty-acid desaturase [Hondaea fermentalgiana]
MCKVETKQHAAATAVQAPEQQQQSHQLPSAAQASTGEVLEKRPTIHGKHNPDLPTLGEIRAAVPKHCFERSLLTSSLYLGRDLVMATILFCTARHFLPVYDMGVLGAIGWTAYVIVQGTVFAGLWVLGHECGHQAFSNYRVVNDTVGYLVHTALLVPYFSWAYTHGLHHARVNHMLDGESHTPNLQKKVMASFQKFADLMGDEAFAVFHVFIYLLLAWPLYIINGSGASKRNHEGKRWSKEMLKRPNHFLPTSELFPDKMRLSVAGSTAGVLVVIAGLCYWGSIEGSRTVLLQYFLPYLVVNAYLIGFTWMQHTHPDVPHLGEDEWSWVAGTILTIDRPYPAFIDVLTHRIGSTHVAHHLFSKMPWYHAREATVHIKALLEPKGVYNYDPTPFYKALYNTARYCHFMEGVEGIQFFKHVDAQSTKAKVL